MGGRQHELYHMGVRIMTAMFSEGLSRSQVRSSGKKKTQVRSCGKVSDVPLSARHSRVCPATGERADRRAGGAHLSRLSCRQVQRRRGHRACEKEGFLHRKPLRPARAEARASDACGRLGSGLTASIQVRATSGPALAGEARLPAWLAS